MSEWFNELLRDIFAGGEVRFLTVAVIALFIMTIASVIIIWSMSKDLEELQDEIEAINSRLNQHTEIEEGGNKNVA